MCLLLTSFTSFVDLPFQEHWMMEKHHMDQNPYISSLCPKPGVVTNNMTQGKDVAQSPGLAEPKWGRSPHPLGRLARVWRFFEIYLQLKSVRRVSNVRKVVRHKTWPPNQVKWPVSLTSGPPELKLRPRHRLNPLINTLLLLPIEGVKKVRFSPI
jgi:hypothetical protein